MFNLKKSFTLALAGFALAGCLSIGASASTSNNDFSAANADQTLGSTVYPPEGGCWEYGYNFAVIFSDYFHQSNRHKSLCIGVGGHEADSGWQPCGVKSVSSWGVDPFGNNHWYYDVA